MRYANVSFDPETMALIGYAFERAISDLLQAGMTVSDAYRVQIADRILNAAAAGERDLKTLVHQAIVDATK